MENVLGNAIKKLRKERHLTQKDLGRLTGFSQNTVSQHENGTRTLDDPAIRKYAAALDTTPQGLFDIYLLKENSESNSNIQNSRVNKTIEDTINIMKELNPIYQKRVYSYAKEQYDNQKMAFPETLAAHQADPSHTISDQEAKDIGDYLDSEIDKYNRDK